MGCGGWGAGRYDESGSKGVWASGPPGKLVVEGGVQVDMMRVAPRVFGPLGLLENELRRLGYG